MRKNTIAALALSLFSTFAFSGCIADEALDVDMEGDEEQMDLDSSEGAVEAATSLDRPANAKLRVAVWNTLRGSIFPSSDDVWNQINLAKEDEGGEDMMRRANGKAVLKAVNANVWLLQETAYKDLGLPDGISRTDINNKISGYMKSVTGDSSWQVRCNGRGLCLMVRGNIKIDATCLEKGRVNGYMLRFPSYNNTTLAIANVHFMNEGHATDAVTMMTASVASARIVAGDFNDNPKEPAYAKIKSIPKLDPVTISQTNDPAAIHLGPDVVGESFRNTKGYLEFGANEGGQAIAESEYGGHIDHFFFSSAANNWTVRKKLILNSLLLAKSTLKKYNLSPLAVAVRPEQYAPYFSDFMTTGKVKPIVKIGSTAPPSTTVDHDHLPYVVDLDFPNAPSAISPKLVCPD